MTAAAAREGGREPAAEIELRCATERDIVDVDDATAHAVVVRVGRNWTTEMMPLPTVRIMSVTVCLMSSFGYPVAYSEPKPACR